jgi:hypothetical protein
MRNPLKRTSALVKQITKHDTVSGFSVARLDSGEWVVCYEPALEQPAGLVNAHHTQQEAEEAFLCYIREVQ